jgi:hypothetical protein
MQMAFLALRAVHEHGAPVLGAPLDNVSSPWSALLLLRRCALSFGKQKKGKGASYRAGTKELRTKRPATGFKPA